MELDRAKEILRSLADGRDPATGQQFPPESPYQQAETVRALYMAMEALVKGGRAHVPRAVDPNRPKAGGSWSPEEEQQLRDAFTAHKPINDIAAAHSLPAVALWRRRGRTTGAIAARLVRLGLIQDIATNRAGVGNRPPISPRRSIGPITPASGPPPAPPAPHELTQEDKDNLPF